MGGKELEPIDYFERQTTQRNDYRWPKDVKRELASWPKQRDEVSTKELPPLAFMDVETLVPYRPGIHIPFNLHFQKKPILQTNPKENFELKLNQELPKDDDNIRFTRPRVYKCPEISLDDIPDKKIRDMIIDFTYASTWSADSHDAAGSTTRRNIPTTTWQSPIDDDVRYKGETHASTFEQEWGQKCGKDWDKLQTCYTADPDKMFWTDKQNGKSELKNLVSNEYIDHIIKLGREEKLRMPYNIPTPGYTGFIPTAPFNIKPEKKFTSPNDCQLSLNTAIESWKSGKIC